MFNWCENCLNIDTTLKDCFKQIFDENDFDDDDTVTYKQWVSTDWTTLIPIQTNVDEFI